MSTALRKRAEEHDQEFEDNLKKMEGEDSSYLEWVFQERYYPEGLLPAPFGTSGQKLLENCLLEGKASEKWRLLRKISPPDDRLTSEYYAIYQPDALHDFFVKLSELELKKYLRQSSRITSYSLPLPVRKGDEEHVRGVSDHRRLKEDLASDAYNYSTLIKLDIKHCYPSIYSHSIHWAIGGYDCVRRENEDNLTVSVDYAGIGGELDTKIRAMHGGFTKGLAVGPGASDVIAEILLRHIDQRISDELEGIYAYGARFKDDYYIFVKDSGNQGIVCSKIENALKKYLLHLNAAKTCVDQPFRLLQREWLRDYNLIVSDGEGYVDVHKTLRHLAYVADLHQKNPGKRLLEKYLTNTNCLPDNEDDLARMSSVLLSMSDVMRSIVPFAISFMKKSVDNHSLKTDGINRMIIEKIKQENNPYNAIWYLYFMTKYNNDWADYIDETIKDRFANDYFWRCLQEQKDCLFNDRKSEGVYFDPKIDTEIYEETEKYADIY